MAAPAGRALATGWPTGLPLLPDVDLVDQPYFKSDHRGVKEELLQSWSVPGGRGVAVVDIQRVDRPTLALGMSPQGLFLRRQGISLPGLVLGGYAGIDGPTDKRVSCCLYFEAGEPKISRFGDDLRAYEARLEPVDTTSQALWLGENVKRVRTQKGLYQDKLSTLDGVSLTALVKIESGASDNPKIKTLNRG